MNPDYNVRNEMAVIELFVINEFACIMLTFIYLKKAFPTLTIIQNAV